MGRFGETAEEHEIRRGSDDDIWIKGFRSGDTDIRILQPTNEWITYREHYCREIKAFYPCTEDSECLGCSHESEATRKRSRKYAVNCLDAEGRLNVFKFGSRLFRTLKGREERAKTKTICDRDYTIMKTGSGMETTYDIEAGEKYEIDDLPELVDIIPLLEAAYERAEALYSGEGKETVEEDEEPEDEAPRRRIGATKKAAAPAKKAAARRPADEDDEDEEPPARPAAKRAAAPAKKAAAPAKRAPAKKAAAPEPEPEEEAEPPTGEISFEDMSTKEIKEWLDEQGVEYPETAPRSQIVKIAKGYEY